MSNYQYGKDILKDVLFRGGEKDDLIAGSTDYLEAAKKYIMRSYYDMISEYPFPSSLSNPPGIINTVGKVTGTATCTKGSAGVTFGAVISPSMTGMKFYVDGSGIRYRIASHTSGANTAILDATYKEDTTTGAFTAYQDEYALAADCIALWKAADRSNSGEKIAIISMNEMDDVRGYVGTEGTRVSAISIIQGGLIRVIPWTASSKTIEYVYTKRPPTLTWDGVASTDTPAIDEEHRHFLADFALFLLLENKRDERAKGINSLAISQFASMKLQSAGEQRPRWYVKRGQGIWR